MSKNGKITALRVSATVAFYSDAVYSKIEQYENRVAKILTAILSEFDVLSVKTSSGQKFIIFPYDDGYRLAFYRGTTPTGHKDYENLAAACVYIAGYANENDLYYKAA